MDNNIKIRLISSQNKSVSVSAGQSVLLLDKIGGRQNAPRSLVIRLAPGAKAQHVLLFQTEVKAKNESGRLWQRDFKLGAGSQLDSFRLFLGQGNYNFSLNSYLGTKATLNARSIAWTLNQQQLDINDNYIFTGPGSYGRFNAASLVAGSSQVNYFSDLIIKSKAQKSDSRVDLDFYPLSLEARGRFRPSLKIAANDVKAGHGASSLKLSPQDRFYLQSRGLSPKQIQVLILDALSQRFTAQITDASLAAEILDTLKKRSIE